MGRAPSLSASAGCLQTRGGSQKSKAADYPQMNLSHFELSPLRRSPPGPGPQRDVPGTRLQYRPQPVPRGSLRGPRNGPAAFSISVPPGLCSPCRPLRPGLRSRTASYCRPQLCLQLPRPSTAIIFNDVQIGLGHSNQSEAQRLGDGTWWLFIQG